jgi:hypothetical protein
MATSIIPAVVIGPAIVFLLWCYRGFDRAQQELTSRFRSLIVASTSQEEFSRAGAEFQVPRVARARRISKDDLRKLVRAHTEAARLAFWVSLASMSWNLIWG